MHAPRTWLVLILSAVVQGLTASPSGVQTAPGQSAARIHFSVLNGQEKPVLGLSAADFELRVDGKPRPLADFRPGLPHTDRSIPLVAWVLIDFNPNINAALIQQQADAAADLFKLFHPDSKAGVQLVSDRVEILAPLAHDPAALRKAFREFSERRMILKAGTQEDSTYVGPGGLARAAEVAIGAIRDFIRAEPSLSVREVHRAVVILSDGNISPSFKTRPLYESAGRDEVFLYPVFMPRQRIGPWISDYFELAKKSGGVGAFLGAIRPGSDPFAWSGENTRPNALTFNFIHVARDLNGKYSFTLPAVSEREEKISLRCRVKGAQIRLARKTIP
jgi:hypothetical protein